MVVNQNQEFDVLLWELNSNDKTKGISKISLNLLDHFL